MGELLIMKDFDQISEDYESNLREATKMINGADNLSLSDLEVFYVEEFNQMDIA